MRRIWRISACRSGDEQRSPSRGQGLVSSVLKVSVARPVCHCRSSAPARSWLLVALAGPAAGPAGPAGRAVQPAGSADRDRDGRAAGRARLVHRGRGNGRRAARSGYSWAARMPSAQAGGGLRRPVGEDDPAGLGPVSDHDLADDLLCGWTGELAAACEGPVPGQAAGTPPGQGPQGEGQGPQGRQAGQRGARELFRHKQARKAARRERKAAAAAIAAAAQAIAGGRAKLPAVLLRPRPGPRHAPGAARRGLRRPPPRPRPARPGRRRQSQPRRQAQRPGSAPALGVLLARYPAQRRPAWRGPQNERDDRSSARSSTGWTWPGCA